MLEKMLEKMPALFIWAYIVVPIVISFCKNINYSELIYIFLVVLLNRFTNYELNSHCIAS